MSGFAAAREPVSLRRDQPADLNSSNSAQFDGACLNHRWGTLLLLFLLFPDRAPPPSSSPPRRRPPLQPPLRPPLQPPLQPLPPPAAIRRVFWIKKRVLATKVRNTTCEVATCRSCYLVARHDREPLLLSAPLAFDSRTPEKLGQSQQPELCYVRSAQQRR